MAAALRVKPAPGINRMSNAHDLVRYPDLPFPRTHPAALGAFAALFGRPYAPFAASRVLEIGCGGGVNLLSIALGAPDAEFVGVDLAERPIALARAAAQASGIGNARFHVQNILEMDASLGRFDYIIAHGVYAWVPPAVSQALMRIVGQLLTPHGLAMISYNTYPGCHLRQAARDIMRAAARGVVDPHEKLAAARAALADHIAAWSEADAHQYAMAGVARDMLDKPAEVLFHDELTAFYEPALLSDVVAAAAEVGLDYLCDAQPQLTAEAFFPSEKFAAVRAKAAGDWVRFEQLMDFSEMRFFRSSIFCRGGGADRRLEARRLRGLWASGDLVALAPDPEAPDNFAFRCEGAAKIATNNPKLARFLGDLAAAFPSTVALDAAAEDPALAEYVLTLFVANAIRIVTAPLSLTLLPGDRPIASPLARFQAARGEKSLASLRHYPLNPDDASTLLFVTLLDGTRTRDDLAREIAEQGGMTEEVARAQVSSALTELGRLGLMMA
jgi:2-polyprenyl-3-methyl-5-hydroxy-6-metoxy-1,4-benzoquinol methylase